MTLQKNKKVYEDIIGLTQRLALATGILIKDKPAQTIPLHPVMTLVMTDLFNAELTAWMHEYTDATDDYSHHLLISKLL